MNITSTNNHPRLMALIVCVMILIMVLSGCSQVQQTPQPSSVDVNATSQTSPEQTAQEQETPTPTTSGQPDPIDTAVLSETEKLYISKIDNYLSKIPIEKTAIPVSSDDQKLLVESMVSLYSHKATSKEFYDLYLNGIMQLSPDNADKFTFYAISGMRRNSFEDYTSIEKYTNESGFLDDFFKEAESTDYNYIKFNHDIQKIKNTKIKELVGLAQSQGYYVASSEGMLYYLVDFTVFASFRSCNTMAMASLIESLAIDAMDPMTSDAAFIISGDTLAARTYNIQKMLSDYKGTFYEKYLAVRFRDHMTLLLYGVDNTPTFSYETGSLTEEATDLFKDVQSLESSFMGKLTDEFTKIIEANKGIINDVTRDKAQAIFKEIDEKYGLNDEVMNSYGQWMSGNIQIIN